MTNMTIIVNGFLGPLLLTGGYAGGSATQTFRAALTSKLGSIPELTAIVGSAIYPSALPETHDLSRDGPAVTYTITAGPRGHVLGGADGTATAHVELSSWSYLESQADAIALAIWNALDGIPGKWGNGTCVILAVAHDDEIDLAEPPKAGSDQWVYRMSSPYIVRYRTGFPTLA